MSASDEGSQTLVNQVEAIRSTHPKKGGKRQLSWQQVADMTDAIDPSPTHSYASTAYRRWSHDPKQTHVNVEQNLETFVRVYGDDCQIGEIAPTGQTDSDKRDRDAAPDTDAETESEDPAPEKTPSSKKAKTGPAVGSRQAGSVQTIKRRTSDGMVEETHPVPAQFTLISDKRLRQLEKLEEEDHDPQAVCVDFVRKQLSRKGVKEFAPEVVSLYQRALGVVPSVGRDAIATVAALFSAAFLVTLGLGDCLQERDGAGEAGGGLPTALEGIGRHCPGSSVLNSWMTIGRLQNQDRLKQELKGLTKVHAANDKGHAKGRAVFPKAVSFFDFDATGNGGKVATRLIDIDSTGTTTEDSTHSMVVALKSIGLGPDGDLGGVVVSSLTTDSGGAGVLEDAVDSYQEHGIADEETLVVNCMLHALNLLISAPFPRIYGSGGMEKSNALQLLYSCYYFQGLFTTDQFEAVWADAGCKEAPPSRVQSPVETRWWHAWTAAQHLVRPGYWEDWIIVANYVADAETNMALLKCTVALKFSRDLRCLSIKADVTLLACLADAFFVEQFLWQQGTDSWSKSWGYRTHRMAVHAYLMQRDLNALADSIGVRGKVHAMEPWYECVDLLPANEQLGESGHRPSQPRCLALASEYLQDACDLLRKHTARWWGKLAWTGLADEPVIARALAIELLRDEVCVWQNDSRWRVVLTNTAVLCVAGRGRGGGGGAGGGGGGGGSSSRDAAAAGGKRRGSAVTSTRDQRGGVRDQCERLRQVHHAGPRCSHWALPALVCVPRLPGGRARDGRGCSARAGLPRDERALDLRPSQSRVPQSAPGTHERRAACGIEHASHRGNGSALQAGQCCCEPQRGVRERGGNGNGQLVRSQGAAS
jgi:hypothetical protein